MNDFPEEKVRRLASEAGISKLLAKVFLSRGVEDPGYITEFLNPSMDRLHNPFLMRDMEKAVERIIKALDNNEKILIYGDYDVDGITSTSVLYDFFRSLNRDVCYYIPDRFNEGYGISMASVEKIQGMDIDLMITVDCGITAFEEIKYLSGKGLDVIITDHHECKEELPTAYAVINPMRSDCDYPFKKLAGVGVAYKLVEAVSMRMDIEGVAERYFDLVALGTVADVVPLLGENRIIVKHGLPMIENTTNIGLRALLRASGAEDRKATSFMVSFCLAPRINAAGRIGDAARAVDLFTTKEETEAVKIATELDQENKLRQENELTILEEVKNIIEKSIDLKKDKVIVVAGEGWHHGIIGIVASKITDKYYRPCIIISVEDDMAKGSGRSIEGFNLFEALEHCQSLLERHGGHEQAAGLTLKRDKIDDLRRRINEYADLVLDKSALVPKIKVDASMTKEDIVLENVRMIELLEPFGANNPQPLLRCDNLVINEVRAVGQNKHAKIRFNNDGLITEAIGFNMGEIVKVYGEADVVDVVCTMEANLWNGNESVQLNIKDLRPGYKVIKENKFYMSLDRSVDFSISQKDDMVDEVLSGIRKISSEIDIVEAINEFLSKNERVAILVNSINALHSIEYAMERYLFPIRDKYMTYYLCTEPRDSKPVSIVVNPYPAKEYLSNFDRVILYGEWTSKHYLYNIVRLIDLSRVYVYNRIIIAFNDDDILLKRQDMVAVFKYLKSNYDRDIIIENLFAFARGIERHFNIPMNYFKVKRAIQVLEEISILAKMPFGKYGLKITMLNTGKDKKNLEDSRLFKSIQSLLSS
jgi:single-stranded-DNA-specific exonuclease